MAQEAAAGPIIWEENQDAPFIIGDLIGTATVIDGTFQITLGAQKLIRGSDGKLSSRAIPTAHLRFSPRSAKELVDALRNTFKAAQAAAGLSGAGNNLPN